jgi:hypothetical protein
VNRGAQIGGPHRAEASQRAAGEVHRADVRLGQRALGVVAAQAEAAAAERFTMGAAGLEPATSRV